MTPRTKGKKKASAIFIGLGGASKDTQLLAEDLGYLPLGGIFQNLPQPSRDLFLGKGKVDEVKALLDSLPDETIVIVAGDLTPRQHFELEKRLGRTVKDRVRLILEAFETGAQGKVAKMEVKLAHLEFEIPYLREFAHLITQSERAGFYAGGEQRVDVYLQQIRRERQKILRDLKAERNMKEIWSRRRKDMGFFQISFAGFTNSGKTTLFNIMTRSSEEVSSRLFTTLETRTAGAAFAHWGPVLFSDTVGFFSDLPPWIFKAFESTLDELFNSDGLIVMVDGSKSADAVVSEAEKSLAILGERVQPQKLLLLLNKADALGPDRDDVLRGLASVTGAGWLPISCLDKKTSKRELQSAILAKWFGTRFVIPVEQPGFSAVAKRLGKMAIVEEDAQQGAAPNLPRLARYRVPDSQLQRFKSVLEGGGCADWRTEAPAGSRDDFRQYV